MGKFRGTIICPKCEAELEINARDEVITKAVPAEKEQHVDVRIVEVE